ncbi:CRISPR-associated protein [Clostridium novyi]|uniref:RAMP superfamily CRISPR-associated protein n=1 Tax=Clostridium novyi TaxID=1542 RepID=UPI000EA07320|nr:RAMP superfamily CRISPR-associated protein [Clostridium novyi]AYF54391.1 CRISPR-associated protein [Clostridium novyi]
MIKYPVEIKLLSETTFGSGESKNGNVNTDILLDNEGLPYFLGKTFKGCLRKSIEDILKPFYCKSGKNFSQIIKDLFGRGNYKKDPKTKEEKESIEYQRDGKLKFSNFYLHKDILDIFDKGNKDEILDVLTDVRFSIKMNEELGVADKGSLRAIRVLKKDLVFVGFIECENKLADNEFEILKRGILSLKNLGVNKSRGKGHVEVSIGEEINVNNVNENKISADCNYLFYEIDLKEPVKIGDSSSKYDYEESKLYITGSAIRGAIIKKYLAKEILDLDILKKVIFSDSYPIFFDGKKRYSFPTPNIFVISKDTDKSDQLIYTKEKFSNLLDELQGEEQENNKERRVTKLKKGSFSYYVKDESGDKKTLYQFDVKKDFKFHHTKVTDEENIFIYEAISKNQQFYGVIDMSKLDSENKKKIINVLKTLSVIYLGGSRTGGYGRTEITSVESIKDFKELKRKLNYLNYGQSTKEINDIYLLSDVILRDKNHQIISNFSEEYLKEILDDSTIEILSSQINPTIIKGFNSKWKSQIPQSYAMEKGSVIRIKGNLDNTKIDKFMNKYHGDKVQDGLGRVIINPVFLDVDNIEYKEYESKVLKGKDNIEYNSVNIETIEKLKESKEEKYSDKKIKEYISKNIYEEPVDGLSLSQINNVIYEIDKCIIYEKNKKQYLDKLKEISTNKNKTENNRNILDIKIYKNISFEDVLNDNIRKDISNLLQKVFDENVSIINKIDKDKILLKISRWKLYYITKLIKLKNFQKEGDNNE